jgi:hypothetical protein
LTRLARLEGRVAAGIARTRTNLLGLLARNSTLILNTDLLNGRSASAGDSRLVTLVGVDASQNLAVESLDVLDNNIAGAYLLAVTARSVKLTEVNVGKAINGNSAETVVLDYLVLFHFTSRMSNSPLSPSPAGFPPTTLTPCPTPPSSVFSRLSQPKTVAKQLEEAAVGALPPNPTIENLPKITWKNRRFVLEDLLARKGAKGRKSWIRSHGTFLVELNYNHVLKVWNRISLPRSLNRLNKQHHNFNTRYLN